MARSRFTECVTELHPFTAEGLEKVIHDAVEAEEKKSGVKAVDYEVQKQQNVSIARSYEDLMEEIQAVGQKFVDANKLEELTEIVEDTLGKGKKVSECTKKQTDAMEIILDNLKEKAEELGL